MFLDDEFYLIFKKSLTSIEIAQELHKVIVNHIKVQVLDKHHRTDKDLLIVCERIDKQFKTAIQRLEAEGINDINPNFVPMYFKKAHPEIAKHLYK